MCVSIHWYTTALKHSPAQSLPAAEMVKICENIVDNCLTSVSTNNSRHSHQWSSEFLSKISPFPPTPPIISLAHTEMSKCHLLSVAFQLRTPKSERRESDHPCQWSQNPDRLGIFGMDSVEWQPCGESCQKKHREICRQQMTTVTVYYKHQQAPWAVLSLSWRVAPLCAQMSINSNVETCVVKKHEKKR